MSTTRSKRTRNRAIGAGGITEIDYLFYTFGQFFDAEGYEDGKTKEELKAFWSKHCQVILQRYLEENRRKGKGWEGKRPDFFWQDLTEPRLKTGTREYYKPWPDREKYIKDVYETDFEFLKRLGLLQNWEIEKEVEVK